MLNCAMFAAVRQQLVRSFATSHVARCCQPVIAPKTRTYRFRKPPMSALQRIIRQQNAEDMGDFAQDQHTADLNFGPVPLAENIFNSTVTKHESYKPQLTRNLEQQLGDPTHRMDFLKYKPKHWSEREVQCTWKEFPQKKLKMRIPKKPKIDWERMLCADLLTPPAYRLFQKAQAQSKEDIGWDNGRSHNECITASAIINKENDEQTKQNQSDMSQNCGTGPYSFLAAKCIAEVQGLK